MAGPEESLPRGRRVHSAKGLEWGRVFLIGLVDGADFALSAESFTALQRVCAAMNGTLEEWQKLKENELANFRKLVDSQKSGAIPDYPAIAAEASCGK